MARFEKDFSENGHAVSLDELLDLLDRSPPTDRSREEAIACYLSGAEGWREAVKKTGGAFAAEATGLKVRKDD